jgi:hypothetical protein
MKKSPKFKAQNPFKNRNLCQKLGCKLSWNRVWERKSYKKTRLVRFRLTPENTSQPIPWDE